MWKTSGNVFLRLQREWESFSYFRNTVLNDSNMIRTHNHLVLKRTLNHSAKPVWLNGWVFVYKHCEFKSRCCHLNFRYGTCFEQGVHWHSGNYKVWIHSETQTWHDNNIQTVLNQGGACPPPPPDTFYNFCFHVTKLSMISCSSSMQHLRWSSLWQKMVIVVNYCCYRELCLKCERAPRYNWNAYMNLD